MEEGLLSPKLLRKIRESTVTKKKKKYINKSRQDYTLKIQNKSLKGKLQNFT
jgi:hypothetical protein